MKNIQNLKTGEVIRTNDANADQKVREGNFIFVPKKEKKKS